VAPIEERASLFRIRNDMIQPQLRIPGSVRIGVTGHRNLVNAGRLADAIRRVLARLDDVLRHTPHAFTVVSPLAEGADQLVARVVLERPVSGNAQGPTLDVPLPLPESDYLQDFSSSDAKEQFRTLFARAHSSRVLDTAPSLPAAYEQAGRYVVQNCDLLIAIWDGKPARGQGGTAEIVEYARQIGRTVFRIDAETDRLTEERGSDQALESLERLDAYNAEHLSGAEADAAAGSQYEDLARQAQEAGLAADLLAILPKHLLPHFVRADLLAVRYQRRHARAGTAVYLLAAAALTTVVLQTLFLPDLPQLLWLEVTFMAAILLLLAASRADEWHRKWIDYRFLAERLRAALFLSTASLDCDPPKPLPHLAFSHRPDDWMVRAFTWIWNTRPRDACDRTLVFEPLRNFILAAWIAGQAGYYRVNSGQHRRKHRLLVRSGEALFALTLVAAAVHATAFGERVLPALPSLPDILAAAATILPGVGAALAGIRMHREYLRNAERYSHMARYLASIAEQIGQTCETQSLIGLLREANDVMLRENQDWRVVVLFQDLEAP
jgi:hypothetical protein